MPFDWNFAIGAKGGQKNKEKKGETVTTSKTPEHTLKVKLKGFEGEDVEDIVKDIIENIDNLDEVTLSFSGPKSRLEASLKQIAKLIAEAGGQQTLDIVLGKEEKATA